MRLDVPTPRAGAKRLEHMFKELGRRVIDEYGDEQFECVNIVSGRMGVCEPDDFSKWEISVSSKFPEDPECNYMILPRKIQELGLPEHILLSDLDTMEKLVKVKDKFLHEVYAGGMEEVVKVKDEFLNEIYDMYYDHSTKDAFWIEEFVHTWKQIVVSTPPRDLLDPIVPYFCLRFVAMLKHHHKIKAWASRAREKANAPGGAAAKRAETRFYTAAAQLALIKPFVSHI